MKRLTQRDEYGNADIIGVDSADLQLNLEYDEFNLVTKSLNRLASYEDTGLTPEEIKAKLDGLDDYQKLDAQGRLVVLPCKVGDTIFELVPNVKERLPECPLSEVVFCKDCANCVRADNWEMWCTGRGFPNVLVRDEDYCSHGRRKMTEV